MKQHAMRTAMTLYESGTLDIQTAASHAGVPEDRLRRAVRRVDSSEPTVTADPDRVPLEAD